MIKKMVTIEKLSTKAGTLQTLQGRLQSARVLPVYILHQSDYLRNKEKEILEIQNAFSEEKLAVRSSCQAEDQSDTSNAGRFESFLNISRTDSHLLMDTIDAVFASYGETNYDEEVLIQPMLQNITRSGVVFTCDLDTLAPYYCINYDEGTESDTITSGAKNDVYTYVHYKYSPIPPEDKQLARLIDACREMEERFGRKELDIEFAEDNQNELYILQVRPIVINQKVNLSYLNLSDALYKIHSKIQKLSCQHPNLLGDRTVFGVMPDWNPAEIIGIRPKKLALSLYKELVTDSIWAYQRNDYGYRDLRSHPLLVSFLGVPFVDVRITFNSFIPKALDEQIAQKLVNHYIDRLIEVPSYHDKVEFEIVHSCYYLNLPEKLQALVQHGFSENEIKRIEFSLLELTNAIIHPEHGLYKKDMKKNQLLEEKLTQILDSDLTLVDKIYWLLEDCKRYGTLPFAGIARAGFIAVQFLHSFVELGILTKKEKEAFMNGLCTVNKQLARDLQAVFTGAESKEGFLRKYGHIRPGTYDILSKRYDEDFDKYFPVQKTRMQETLAEGFTFTESQLREIDRLLTENGLKVNAEQLLKFIREAIEGRESAKFLFTKSLSQALKLLELYGERNGVTREELAFLDIAVVKDLYSTLDHRDVRETFLSDIHKNKDLYQYTQAIRLPSVILDSKDVYGFYLLREEPNFITLKTVVGAVVQVEQSLEDVSGKIVCIPSADPGYDYLFSKNIGGLITKFGGANSHMAIRCAELGIPAVIGAGELNYAQWTKAACLEINALDKKVRCMDMAFTYESM